MAGYDRAVTIFSPDGHLLQVEYAQQAVHKGSTAVGVRGDNYIVMGVEKKSMPDLRDRIANKINLFDSHILMAFAGFTADARLLIQRAQVECQSYKLNVEDPVTVTYITRYIAQLKQKYTQSSGRRPFGVSCLIGGFDPDGTPHLFQTEPSGIYYEWKANATGRSSKVVREFLEKHYTDTEVATEKGVVKLAIRAIMEVVPPRENSLEIAVLQKGKAVKILDNKEIKEYTAIIEQEKESEKKK